MMRRSSSLTPVSSFETPSDPPIAKPAITDLPSKTPFTPNARALKTSVPHAIPLLTKKGIFRSITFAMRGNIFSGGTA
jgi:hypothetical protein